MAKDTQTKKRKASAPEADIEKPTKIKSTEKSSEPSLKKRKATEDVASPKIKKAKTPAEPKPKPSKKIEAAKDETVAEAPEEPKVAAVSKKPNGVEKVKETTADSPVTKAPKEKKEKKAAKSKTKKSAPEPVAEEKDDDEMLLDGEDGEESEEDDQTQALIKGFESENDDEEMEDAGAFNGQDIPKIPAEALTMSKTQQKKIRKLAEEGAKEESGVVYIGRIPHGFYENEMKAYFKQFGTITNLRVSRNKKTGASKHYAFIEFESGTVAEIVAKTMDNYLMFNHILKVKLVPAAQVHADLFKGANKRFKKVPWNKIAGRKLSQGLSEEKWDERVDREEERRVKKADKLKAIGYEFEAPKVKTTKEIVKKEKLAVGAEVSEPAAVEAAPVAEETKPAKKGKKSKAAATEVKPAVIEEPVKEVEAVESKDSAPAAEASEKPKKGKKVKVTKEIVEAVKPDVIETTTVTTEVVEAPKAKKGKKAKVVKGIVEEVEVVQEVLPSVIEAPAKSSNKKRKAETTLAEPAAEVPEKKIKKKTKATLVVESEDVVPEAATEKVRKIKKSKK